MRANKILALLRLLRPHQWAKNLLLFVALLTSHRWGDADAVLRALQMFAAFCLAASAVYVVNDRLDVAADRAHPEKQTRPFASGALSPQFAWVLVPVLVIFAGLVARGLPDAALLDLGVYLALAWSYCIVLKRLLWLDVLSLAGLYTLRVIAGAHAIEVVPSPWLLAFAMFTFFSLAALKRYADLCRSTSERLAGRAYRAEDALPVLALGSAGALTAVLVLALYVNSPEVRALYATPQWIWLICPLLLYWLARLWTLAERGAVRSDPLLFALRDPASLIVAAATFGLVFLAI